MLVENRQFEPTPPSFGAPIESDFANIFNIKIRVPELSYDVIRVILRLAVSV